MTHTTSVSGADTIDLDRLNSLLVAVNALYLSQTGAPDTPERLTVAEAVRLSPKPGKPEADRKIKRQWNADYI